MTYLLDVNVLIALIDPMHLQHEVAHNWFSVDGKRSWASCPLTENGVIRIIGNSRYPNSSGTPGSVLQIMKTLCALPGHEFWPDDISFLNSGLFNASRLLDSAQVTDSYLLGLACTHGAKLATFDRRLVVEAVTEGAKGLFLIG